MSLSLNQRIWMLAWPLLLSNLTAPLLGLVTMHFIEGVMRRRAALSKLWLRATRTSTLEAIAARREELVARIAILLEEYRATTKS